MSEFDVFISYNRRDTHAAEQLAEALRALKLTLFFDRDELLPGSRWRPQLADALRQSRSIAVLIGQNGMGRTQRDEAEFAVAEQSLRMLPVFQVILPGSQAPKETTWIGLNTYVDLSSGINNPNELARIRLAIEKAGPRDDAASTASSSASYTSTPPLTVVDDSVRALLTRLKEGHVTFFVGSGMSFSPSPSDMALRITEQLRKNDPGLPSVPALDLASMYYAVDCNDELAVETEIQDLLGKSPGEDESIHDQLAQVARQMREQSKPDPSQENVPVQQFKETARALLIVTTNYDLLTERALVRAGVSFRRIVQFTSQPRLDVSNFSLTKQGTSINVGVSDDQGKLLATKLVFKDDWAAIKEIVATRVEPILFQPGTRSRQGKNPLTTLPMTAPGASRQIQVVLYKPYGSQDRSGSFAISRDHHYRFALRNMPDGMIPAQILETVKNAPIVFLGYNLFDPAYRLVSHTLIADRLHGAKTYVVRSRPPSTDLWLENRMEAALWSDVKEAWSQRGFTFIEATERVFLERLGERVAGSGLRL